MDKVAILLFFERLDQELNKPTMLYLYGSAVVIIFDAPGRTSMDIDVAGPYSSGNMREIIAAIERAGLPVNPDVAFVGHHVEWVGPLRLCLPTPKDTNYGMVLWQGEYLTVRTGTIGDLVASKLIRYDEIDRGDIQHLFTQYRFSIAHVQDAVDRLPHPFTHDTVVRENLENLQSDIELWDGV